MLTLPGTFNSCRPTGVAGIGTRDIIHRFGSTDGNQGVVDTVEKKVFEILILLEYPELQNYLQDHAGYA